MRALALLLFVVFCVAPAGAQSHMRVGAEAVVPVGWRDFCKRHSQDCQSLTDVPQMVILTNKLWWELVDVNQRVNGTIKPKDDVANHGVVEYWDYPYNGYGDCEDYVLEKRWHLIELGWPQEALLITIVQERGGSGHAVLTVRTDAGDFVLDNQNRMVLAWYLTGYRFKKRQALSNPNRWLHIIDERPVQVAGPLR